MKKISLAFSGGGCSIIYYSRLARILYEKGVYCISDFPTPIIIQSVNARTGEVVYFSNLDIPDEKVIKHASVKEAIMTSTAFPGLYKGITVKDDDGNDLLLTDGGVRSNVCIKALKKITNTQVWACTYFKKCKQPANHFLGIAQKLLIGSLDYITERELSLADKVLEIKRTSSTVLDVKVRRFDEMEKSGEAQLLSLLD